MTDTRARIVIVEDDPEIRPLLTDFLEKEGFRAEAVASATAFDTLIAHTGEPDLAVLDVNLPGEDGLSLCRRIRVGSRLPIIMLTARGEDVDRIVGLEMGADDYMPKPFNPRELVARIKAILRRSEAPPPDTNRPLCVGPLTVKLEARSVSAGDGSVIMLTAAEFALLECFVTRPGRVLTRDQLMDWTRGRSTIDPFDRTIDVQLSRLRKKIEQGGEPLIKTVRGAGYVLAAPVRPAGG